LCAVLEKKMNEGGGGERERERETKKKKGQPLGFYKIQHFLVIKKTRLFFSYPKRSLCLKKIPKS